MVLVLVAGVKVIGAALGSEDTVAGSESTDTSATAASDDSAAGEATSADSADSAGAATGVLAPTATDGTAADGPAAGGSTPAATVADSAPATAPGPPVTPSAATPAKVLIAGDSEAGTFGPYLVELLDQTGVVETTLDYKVSSGLARPDFFDWPARLREQVTALDPDIVIVTFGGNDAQGLSTIDGTFVVGQPSGTDPAADAEWRAEYGRRVGEVMDYLSAEGRTLVWVGIPNGAQDSFTARVAVQNEVAKAEVAKRPEVVFVDTWSRFSGRDGNFAEFVIDPRDGVGKDVRADDGFHLNENGAEILALDIAEAVRAELRERGAVL